MKKIIIIILNIYLLKCSTFNSLEENINEDAYNGDIESVLKGISKKKTVNFQDSRGWTPLMAAIENNQLNLAEKLLSNGAYLDIKNEAGDTALMRAVYMNHTVAINFLIEKGASIKIRDNKGYTPFLRSCDRGKLDSAKLLGKEKSDFKDRVQDPVKKTTLHLAIKKENLELIKWLIENGSDLNAKDEEGFTPIMDAIRYNKIEAVRFFLGSGANTSDISIFGDSIQSLARQTFNTEMIKMMDSMVLMKKK